MSYQCNYIVYQLKKIFVDYFDSCAQLLVTSNENIGNFSLTEEFECGTSSKETFSLFLLSALTVRLHLTAHTFGWRWDIYWCNSCVKHSLFFCYLQSLLMERDLLLKNILCNYTKWGFFACYDTQKPNSASEKSWSETVCLLRGGWKWAWSHCRRGLGICPYED